MNDKLNPDWSKTPQSWGIYSGGGCQHPTLVPVTSANGMPAFQCQDCKRLQPQSLVEEFDGGYRMKKTEVPTRRPRRR